MWLPNHITNLVKNWLETSPIFIRNFGMSYQHLFLEDVSAKTDSGVADVSMLDGDANGVVLIDTRTERGVLHGAAPGTTLPDWRQARRHKLPSPGRVIRRQPGR